MKRFLVALLCALMAGTVLAFAACTDGSSEGGEGNGNGGTPQTPVNPDAELPSFFCGGERGIRALGGRAPANSGCPLFGLRTERAGV